MTPTQPHAAGTVWLKRNWKLKDNPFPTSGIVRLGGKDRRENGLLYDDAVNADKFVEAVEKFVLGAAFSGLRFGYLWSMGIGAGDSEARGFGKSALMQHLAWNLNQDFGQAAYLSCGLDESDAAEAPICGLLTSFDTTQIRSLAAALFTAVEYAVDFKTEDSEPTLAVRLRDRLAARAGDDDPSVLAKLVFDEQRKLRGRTLGPPDEKLLNALCAADPTVAADYLDQVKPATRTRNGAIFLSTFLLFASAAGIQHVLLCCDQLEDLASTTTAKAKRDLETERFRDVILETLPMADMLAVVVTMHPRAALTIGQAWQLADLPSFEPNDMANRHRVVVLEVLHSVPEAAGLLRTYLDAARKDDSGRAPGDLYPMTEDAIDALFARSNRKPRDILRKAHGIFEQAASENLDLIDGTTVARYLDALSPDDDDDAGPVIGAPTSAPDWSEG
jgi:hypothetical protein